MIMMINTTKDTDTMMDELGKEMSSLRRNYPELFPVRILSIDGKRLVIKDMAEALIRLGDAFMLLNHSVAHAHGSTNALKLALEHAQARRRQASWLWRAIGWLRARQHKIFGVVMFLILSAIGSALLTWVFGYEIEMFFLTWVILFAFMGGITLLFERIV
jgi:hypothetical protein